MNNATHNSKCAVCRTTNRRGNVVRERFGTNICDWCALTRGDASFVRARVGDPLADRERLVRQVRLVPDVCFVPWTVHSATLSQIFSIGHAADFEWDTRFKSGVEFGRRWKDYVVEDTGVVIEEMSQPISNLAPPGKLSQLLDGWLSPHSSNPKKLVMFFRFRVFLKDTLAYIESIWALPMTGTPQVDIRNVQFARSTTELDKLFRGVNLVLHLAAELKGGRQKNSGIVNSNNANDFIREIVRIGKRVRENEGRVTLYDVARELGRLRVYGISLRDPGEKGTARKAIARAIKQYDPSWTWRDNIRPLIGSGSL